MIKKALIIILLLLVVGALYFMTTNNQQVTEVEKVTQSNGIEVSLYKSPYCGCCEVWGEYMKDLGYSVSVTETELLSEVKNKYSVPEDLESCHTSEIDGYVVEGHVPNEAIEKLLNERPDIKGIGMAGMPSGSPGMPGIKEDFLIYEINHDGTKGDLFMKL